MSTDPTTDQSSTEQSNAEQSVGDGANDHTLENAEQVGGGYGGPASVSPETESVADGASEEPIVDADADSNAPVDQALPVTSDDEPSTSDDSY